jgi:hypothetical protein
MIEWFTLTLLGYNIRGKDIGGRTGFGRSEVNGYSSGLIGIVVKAFLCQVEHGSHLVYRRALAFRYHPRSVSLQSLRCAQHTMKDFCLPQEPLQPTALKTQVLQFLESSPLIDTRVVCKLSSFYEVESNCILQPD